MKKRIFEIIEKGSPGDLSSRIFDYFIISLIVLNIIAVVLETERGFFLQNKHYFLIFEKFSVFVFTIEYLLRLWSCTIDKRFRNPIKGRILFALKPLIIVDLLAVLPFYLPMIISLDLRFLRGFRIFRLFKMGRYSESLITLKAVLKEKKEELFVTLFIGSILLIIASSLMYYVENKVQPEAFASILTSMWWGVATLTTVGYGDIYPITPLGRLLGAIISILGIGMFALPTGILASGFSNEIQNKRLKQKICPHCKKHIDEL